MRRVAEGQRGNYQDAGSFVDVDDQWDLGDQRAAGVLENIDRQRALEALPGAARYLVHETVITGRSQEELAHDYRVTPAAFCQVLAQLKEKPVSVTRLPGTVDLHGELRKAAKRFLENAISGTTSNAALVQKIRAP